MQNKKINWGILGTAEIAEVQVIPAIQKSKNANLLAIASRSGKEREFSTKYNIPKSYRSYEDLLEDPEIDIIYIPLPNDLHSKWVKAAAYHGKHVLCEKPAALNVQETREMIEICEKHNVLFMEALMYQFHPQHQRVKEMIQAGVIGEIVLMRASFTFMLKKLEGNFRLNPQHRGGGSIYDIGCYCIHAIREIMGEPTKVSCIANMSLTHQVDWSAIGILEFENGVKSYFDCGMNMSTRHEYEIVGTKGSIRVPKAFIPQEDGEGIIQLIDHTGKIGEEKYYGNYYLLGIEYLSNCLLENTKPQYTKEGSINNMKVIDACLASIASESAFIELN
ncbi:oxidoreductase [Collibacillus ludicampi]|uniref:Oxidoreductase n=1 Tax=Collibacillus ludicampi TaxID=2771369 RepID=A0AAV4LIY3_9BACL|nr:Gfo/Idh/MocA family oxidoreductase [Collibacillus ludicampi]GIM47749.1 oxidoreductase [Collibacillus ludicampi]